MTTAESRKMILAGFLVALFFGIPILGIATSSLNAIPEELEPEAEARYTLNSIVMNEPGFHEGSIFTESTFSVNDESACAIMSNNSVMCWGSNIRGQLGNGSGAWNSMSGVATTPNLASVISDSVTSISRGRYHSCAIFYNGSVGCWGYNGNGQLGSSVTISSSSSQDGDYGEIDLPQDRKAIQISSGQYHNCLILDDGSVMCWGKNGNGELGDGSECTQSSTANNCTGLGEDGVARTEPSIVDFGEAKAVSISSGKHHSCAILSTKDTYCWGFASGINSFSPEKIDTPVNSNFVSIDASSRSNHICGITDNGSVMCWGSNSYGQIGNGTTYQESSSNPNVPASNGGTSIPVFVSLPYTRTAKSISVGAYHSCAILDNDSIVCWGSNSHGQLGTGFFNPPFPASSPFNGQNYANDSSLPVYVDFDFESNPVAISLGVRGSCALLANGSIYCWGQQVIHGQGFGNLPPFNSCQCYPFPNMVENLITTDSTVKMSERDIDGDGILNIFDTHMAGGHPDSIYSYNTLAVGSYHICAIIDNGSLVCWGNNGQGTEGGQLGIGASNGIYPPTLVNFTIQMRVLHVSVGAHHSCALMENYSVYCWGDNARGQLGDGTTTDSNIPKWVNLGANRTAIFLDSSGQHNCAILDDGSLKCWGSNEYGESGGERPNCNMGSGGQGACDRFTPNPINLSGNSVIGLSLNWASTCAILENHALWCWGLDGNSDTSNRTIPSEVGLNGQGALAVSNGRDHFCAIVENGSLMCWGYASRGSLGIGGTDTNPPLQYYTTAVYVDTLPANATLTSVSTGSRSTCVTLANDSLYCWGNNNQGLFGDGTTSYSVYSATHIDLGLDSSVAAHRFGNSDYGPVCVMLRNSSLWCWGSNGNGELGNESLTDQVSPVQIDLGDNRTIHSGDSDSDGDGVVQIHDAYPNNPIRSINCPAGSYGRYSCVETTPGHYATAASMYQTKCDPGTYQPNSNQASCISSSPGHYVSNPGSISQMLCPAGTYNTNNGSTSLSDCILSSPGYYAAGTLLEDGFESGDLYGLFDNWSGDIEYDYCDYQNTTNCDKWAVRNYSPLAGNYSLSIGSPAGNLAGSLLKVVSVSINLSHEANFTFSYRVSSEAWDKLTFCLDAVNYTCGAAQQYQYIIGTSQEGGVGPTDNYIRAWSGTGGANSSAQSGNFSIILSAGNHTLHWAYSKDSNANDLDDSAWLDNFSITRPLGSISQTECSPGTYQNLSGQISCNDADPGYFVLNPASTTQSECLQGNYQPLSGQSSCLNASAGYYVPNSGSTNQTACPPGTYNPYIASINSTSCINASPGYFAGNAGSANQTACVPGTYQSNYNQTECIDSSPGFYVSNSGSANQTACSVGTYQPGTNQTNCIDSSPGYYVPNIGSSNQLICNSGTYQPNYGQSSCIDSSPGYYVSNSGQTTQSACVEGTYQPNYNQSGCIDSSPGYYVDNTAMSNQTACPGGTFNPNYGSISSNDCITTSPGYYASSGSGSQNPCQSGTYQPLTGQTNCTSTDPGYYVPGISYVFQLSCNPGTYQPNSGSSDCLITDAGYYVDSYSSDTQTACPAGTFNPVNGSSSYSSCIDTSPGYFTPISGMSEEYPCNPGTYQPLGGQDNCTNSSPGYFVPMNASTTQEPCIVGMYQSNYGRTYCEYPSSGYYVPTSSSSNQTRAEPGHYANANDNDTTTSHPCSLGYYQPNSGQSECIEADSGFYVDNNGSTTQIPCIGGNYNPNNGSISIDSCIDSIPGHYSKDGYSIYIPCELGFYQPNSGQSSCIEADPGFYVDNNGSIDQIPCIEGTYNPNFGADSQDHCVQSNPGYHVPSPGSANQIPCVKGTYQPNFGESNCVPASLGYYVPVEGSISQIAAYLDYYVDYTGSFTTSQCPEFYLTLETGSKTIDECLLDTDLDRNPNIFDEDDDNDNVLDVNDFCPAGQIDWISGFVNDQDIDGCKDSGEDLDDDNDGRLDENDAFPSDSFEQDDNDLDGQGDNLDIDDDNDGLSDILEYDLGTNQFDADTDGDGFNDKIDHFPLDGNEWVDTDGDGVGDNSDFMIEFARYQSKLDVTIDLIAVIIIILSLTVLYRKKTSDSGPPPPPSKKPKKKLTSPPIPPSKKPKKKLDSPPPPPSKKPKNKLDSPPSPPSKKLKEKLESPSPPKSKNNN